jgi:glucose/arabinose dehydrogenase
MHARLGLPIAALTAAALAAAQPAAASITVAPGFRATVVARGAGHPVGIAFGRGASIWTTSAQYGTAPSDGVWMTPRRSRGWGRPRQVVRRLFTALGLAWFRGELYVSYVAPYRVFGAHSGRVDAFSRFDGRRFRRRRSVLRGLPVGQHNVDSIVPGPGGRLYVGIGNPTNAGPPRHSLSAAVVSFLPSGRGLRVEARGLRNPFGLAMVPGTDHLLVTDNGRDDLGPFRPPDELNLVRVPRRGAIPHYGFPACWGQGGPSCRGTVPPLARLPAHASSDGVAVARRLGRYGLSAFIAQNGSSFSANRTGSDVIRVSLTPRGRSYRAVRHPFARGFARHDPVGAAIGPDGAVYVTLLRSGRIVRFAPR